MPFGRQATFVGTNDTLCYVGSLTHKGKGELGVDPSENVQLQIAGVTWRIETKSDSAVYRITLVLVKL